MNIFQSACQEGKIYCSFQLVKLIVAPRTATAWIVLLYGVAVVVAVTVYVGPPVTVIEHVPSGRVIVPPAYEALARIFKSASSIHPSTKCRVSSPFERARDTCPSPIPRCATVTIIPKSTAVRIRRMDIATYPSLEFLSASFFIMDYFLLRYYFRVQPNLDILVLPQQKKLQYL